ncbi:MAG: NAD(P)H-binding protein [Deltaproteobacteria bacterium]|nr:NAD(P)H-binding protein [Deltaproteobacteria bacterium]
MKVVVFGASGRVGRLFVDGALKKNHQVTCFTRNSNNIRVKHKNLRISGGNVSDDYAVREAMRGQELAVVSLGAKDISKPHSVNADGVKRIVAAMDLFKVPRVILLGNVGLLPHASGKLQGEVSLPPFLQFVFADQRTAYETLKESGLDWVVVCPPFMPQGPQTGKYRVVVEAPLERAQSINVEDVVHFLLKEAFEAPHHNVRIGIAY